MKITLDQFQTDFVTGLDSVVVGAQWLQDVLRERDSFKKVNKELSRANEELKKQNHRYRSKIVELEMKQNCIYIMDTLA